MKASLLLLSACQDYEVAKDGKENGLFTSTLLRVYDSEYEGTYFEFIQTIRKRLFYSFQGNQTPNYLQIGKYSKDFHLGTGRPFSIKGRKLPN